MTERFVVRTSQWWESDSYLAGNAQFKGHQILWWAHALRGGLWKLQVSSQNLDEGDLEAKVAKGRIRPTIRRLVRAQYGRGGETCSN